METIAKRRFFLSLLGVLAAALAVAGCDAGVPREEKPTLNYILDHGALRVGVIESMPWAGKGALRAKGVEGWIVAEYAHSVNTKVKWHYLTEARAIEHLNQQRLDIVIGGLTVISPWQADVTFIGPYLTPEDGPGHVIAIQQGQGRFLAALDRFIQQRSADIQSRYKAVLRP